MQLHTELVIAFASTVAGCAQAGFNRTELALIGIQLASNRTRLAPNGIELASIGIQWTAFGSQLTRLGLGKLLDIQPSP